MNMRHHPLAVPSNLAGECRAQGEADPVRASPLLVLLADDCPVERLLACAMLSRWNILPRMACDGMEAVLMASEEDFDIILMDVQMPVMDGLAATMRIRRDEKRRRLSRSVPVVACTDGNLASDVDTWLSRGMNAVLNKRCDAREMSDCLERWCPSRFVAARH